MKRLCFVVFIIVFVLFNSNAQYFSKQLDLNENAEYGVQLISKDNFLLILTNSRCDNNTKRCLSIFKTGIDGEIVLQNEVDSLNVFFVKSMLEDEDGFFLLTSPSLASPEVNGNLILQKFNFGLELITQWHFGENGQEGFPTGLAWLGEEVIISQSFRDDASGEFRGRLQFLDENFQIQNEMIFNENYNNGFAGGSIIVDGNNDILIPLIGVNGGFHTGVLEKIDTSSSTSTYWETTFTTNEYSRDLTIDVVALQNGNYALGWHNDDDNNNWPATVYGVSHDGEIIWEQLLADSIARKNINSLFLAENGDIIGVGSDLFLGGGYGDKAQGGWIFRMSPEGEILWERTIADLSLVDYLPLEVQGEELVAGTELDNGDLVFTGLIQDTVWMDTYYINNPNAWLLRLDSEGCLVPNCGNLQVIVGDSVYTSTEELSFFNAEQQVRLFPNPAKNTLIVDVEDTFFIKNKGETLIEVYDTGGKLVLTQYAHFFPEKLEVSGLAKGLYFIIIGRQAVSRFVKE